MSDVYDKTIITGASIVCVSGLLPFVEHAYTNYTLTPIQRIGMYGMGTLVTLGASLEKCFVNKFL